MNESIQKKTMLRETIMKNINNDHWIENCS